MGMKPADEEHLYGHGRAEPIVGLIIAVFLGIIAFEIITEVYKKIVLGEALTPSGLIAAVMAIIGIFINYIKTNYLINTGKKINSPVLIADGRHQSVDIFLCSCFSRGDRVSFWIYFPRSISSNIYSYHGAENGIHVST